MGVRIGAAIAVVADAASVGSDAGSIRHDGTLVDAPVLSEPPHRLLTSATSAAAGVLPGAGDFAGCDEIDFRTGFSLIFIRRSVR